MSGLVQGYTLINAGAPLRTIFIKFPTQEDWARGFYEPATRARVGSFAGAVYQVPIESKRCDFWMTSVSDTDMRASSDLLTNLKNWRKGRQFRSQVQVTIEDLLDQSLPESFTPDVYRANPEAVHGTSTLGPEEAFTLRLVEPGMLSQADG